VLNALKFRHAVVDRCISQCRTATPHVLSRDIASTPCLKKRAKWFLSQLRQISTNSDNLWHKDGKAANSLKLYEMHSFYTSPNSRQCTTVFHILIGMLVYKTLIKRNEKKIKIKHRCFKLLHNAACKLSSDLISTQTHSKLKYGLFSRIVSLYYILFQNGQNLCSKFGVCPAYTDTSA